MPLQVRAFSFAKGGLVAARALHQSLLTAVMALPAAFFDATPSGRILNRFSSDTGASLPGLLMQQALYKSCNAIPARLVPHPSTVSSLETTLEACTPYAHHAAAVDDSLPFILNILLNNLFNATGVALVLCAAQLYLLAALVPVIAVYRRAALSFCCWIGHIFCSSYGSS